MVMAQVKIFNAPIATAGSLCREANTRDDDLRDIRAGVLNQIKIHRLDGSLVWKLDLPITIVGELRHAGYSVKKSLLRLVYIISWVDVA